jgi:hypothetical protein
VGDERAETYLRLRAEAELRRAAAELRHLDAAAGDQWAAVEVVVTGPTTRVRIAHLSVWISHHN